MSTTETNSVRTISPEQLKMLDICHHIHKQAEEFYLAISDQHREQRPIARMWGELAIDKCNHADAFRMAGRLKGAVIRDIMGASDSAVRLLEKMRTAVKAARQNRLNVDEALRVTINMEENLEKVHIQQVITFLRRQDSSLLTSSLKKNSEIVRALTEHHVNLTLLG